MDLQTVCTVCACLYPNTYILHLQNLHPRCVYIPDEAERDGSGECRRWACIRVMECVWTAESLSQKNKQDEAAGESPGRSGTSCSPVCLGQHHPYLQVKHPRHPSPPPE